MVSFNVVDNFSSPLFTNYIYDYLMSVAFVHNECTYLDRFHIAVIYISICKPELGMSPKHIRGTIFFFYYSLFMRRFLSRFRLTNTDAKILLRVSGLN